MTASNTETTLEWIEEIQIPAPLISYIYRSTQRYFAKELSMYHLGWGHFAILMAVHEMDGPSQDNIALSRGFDKTMVAKSVIRLEEEDLISRISDVNDRRIKKLYLTEKGNEILPKLLQIGQNLNDSMHGGLNESESCQSLEYLKKIAFNISKL